MRLSPFPRTCDSVRARQEAPLHIPDVSVEEALLHILDMESLLLVCVKTRWICMCQE